MIVPYERLRLLRELRTKGVELQTLRDELPGKLLALRNELEAKSDEVERLLARFNALPEKE